MSAQPGSAAHTARIAGNDLAFVCEAGQSLIDAGLRAGIEMPSSCRKGVCGNCAGRVEQGEVAGRHGAAITNETCAPGEVLYCMCEAVSDVVLQPASWRKIAPPVQQSFVAKVYRNTLAAPDVSVLQLRLPVGQRARFRAGQFLQITMQDGSIRNYSMASAPHESDMLTLHIRHVPGGRFTTVVPTLQAGDPVLIELPFGSFSLDESDRPIVFVAGGTGFAPIKSMLDDMARRGVRRAATLYWGARTADGLYLPAAVDKWHKQLDNFRYVPALSDEAAPPEGVFKGFVHDALLADTHTLAGHEVYCCGSPPMVQAVRHAAQLRGLAPEDFHSDVFVTANG
jgi:CDP-4-dehydro-6-deoxyglucose reductase/terephthalate 1,2-dioxygenase reductase component